MHRICETRHEPPYKILVPLDGSPAALRALDHAIALLAGRDAAEIVLIHVQSYGRIDPVGTATFIPPDIIENEAMQQSQQALTKARERCAARGIAFQALARLGDVAYAIADFAKETGAEEIVMGTRGLGTVQELVMGSVATKVIHLTQLPVTLVKQNN